MNTLRSVDLEYARLKICLAHGERWRTESINYVNPTGSLMPGKKQAGVDGMVGLQERALG